MGGLGGHSDSLKYSLEQCKNKTNGHLSDYHKQLLDWYKNVDKRYAWVVLAALWLMMVTVLGPYRIYGLVYAKTTSEGIYTREEASWPVTLIFTVENLLGPLVSIVCYHISKRSALLIGAILISIGNLACWLSFALWQDTIFLGVVQGTGYAFIFMPFMEIINEYFLKYRNVALGFALCGGTMSVFVFGPISQYILDNYHWRTIYLAIGIACSVNILLVPLFKPNKRPVLHPQISRNLERNREDTTDATDKPANSGLTRNLSRISLRAFSYQNSSRHQSTILITRKTTCTGSGLTRCESVISMNPFASSAGLERKISRTLAESCSPNPNGPAHISGTIKVPSDLQPHQQQHLDTISNPPDEYETLSLSEVRQNADFDTSILWDVITTPAFHLIWYNECIYFWLFSIYVLVLTDYGVDRGCTKDEAELLLDFLSIGEMIGRLLLTILVDMRYLSNKNVVTLVLLVLAGFLMMVTQVAGFYWFAAITCCVSATSALLYIMLNGLLVDYLGEKHVTIGYGLASFIGGLLMSFRSSAVGYFRDQMGSYDPLMIAIAIACLIGALFWIIEPILTRYLKPSSLRGSQQQQQVATTR